MLNASLDTGKTIMLRAFTPEICLHVQVVLKMFSACAATTSSSECRASQLERSHPWTSSSKAPSYHCRLELLVLDPLPPGACNSGGVAAHSAPGTGGLLLVRVLVVYSGRALAYDSTDRPPAAPS